MNVTSLLTARFRPSTITKQRHTCLYRGTGRSHPMGYTVSDIAAALRRSARTARRTVEDWAGRQDNPRVPRVSVERPARGTRGGRPRYVVDELSFRRWCRGLPAVEQALAA